MNNMIILALTFLITLTSSCSNQATIRKNDHAQFLKEVEMKKSSLSKNDYKKYINLKLKQKEDELIYYKSMNGQKELGLNQNESMSGQGSLDVHHFNAQGNKIDLYHLNEKIKLLNKELFFLRSQL